MQDSPGRLHDTTYIPDEINLHVNYEKNRSIWTRAH